MIKVLHVITGLNTGGAEMMLFKLLSKMDRKSFEQAVISLSDKGPVGESIESLEIPVYCLGIKHAVLSPFYLLKFVRLAKKYLPDLIQGWMYHGNFAALVGAFMVKRNIPVLWNIRGTHTDLSIENFFTSLLIWLGGKLSSFPVVIVNNSKVSALAHQEKFGYLSDKWEIIPNGFDVHLFQPDAEAKVKLCSELRVDCDSVLIGLVGRYHPMKGHDIFLTAASLLVEKYRNVHFVLIGTEVDIYNNELANRINQLNLRETIHLLGRRTDMVKLTAAFDVACSSSYGEGFSNAIGEAMSCGVPCVVTDVGDSGWIVGETGLVVPPGNPVALADAWVELIDMGEKGRRALGTIARQRVIDNFSLASVVCQYEALYERVLKQNKGNS